MIRHYSGYSYKVELWHQHPEGFSNESEYIHVNGCGYQSIDMDFPNRYSYRVDYQLTYVLKGRAHAMLNNKMTTINEGELFLFFPGEEEYYEYHKEDYTEVYWILFTGFDADKLMTELGFSAHNRVVNVGICEEYTAILEKMIRELQVKKTAYTQLVNSLFCQLLVHFLRGNSHPGSTSKYHKVYELSKVVDHMNRNYNINMHVNDYAKLCCLSRSKFILYFKDFTGLTPLEYLTKVRIEKAKELLIVTSIKVSDISRMIGYDDPLYFCRFFKKHTGFSPTDYREHA